MVYGIHPLLYRSAFRILSCVMQVYFILFCSNVCVALQNWTSIRTKFSEVVCKIGQRNEMDTEQREKITFIFKQLMKTDEENK